MAENDGAFGLSKGLTKLCEEGRLIDALQAVKIMEREVSTSIIFYLVQGCIKQKDLSAGKEVNSLIMRCGFESNTFLGSHLIRMFASCGDLAEANVVFRRLPEPNVFTWNAIISAHSKLRQGERAIELYHNLDRASVRPNEYIFVAVLKACANTAALKDGKLIHSHVTESGFESDLFVGNTLTDMYSKCGCLGDARTVFDNLIKRDVVSWNAIITGYAQAGHGEEALQVFQQMQLEGIQPNDVTFASVVRACSSMGALDKGKVIHDHIIESDFGTDVFVGNILIDMYMACRSLKDACKVFKNLPKRDVVTWSSMISGYAQHGNGHEAVEIFHQMQEEGIKPNQVTYPSVLKACASLAALDQGKQIHVHIILSDCEFDVYIGSALIDMYAKCGNIDDAHDVFDKFPRPNVVTWNAMIGAYAQHEHGQDALQLFQQLHQVGIEPDKGTFVSALKACSIVAALDWGKQIHGQIMESEYMDDLSVSNTLIDMYSKCGSLSDAFRVFEQAPTRSVVTWSAIIGGYALHNNYDVAFQLFEDMQGGGLEPNDVTFVSLISACSHKCQVDQGYHHFQSMQEKYGILPMPEHYHCMVDLLGRAGRLIEAEDLLVSMPFEWKLLGWKSLLSHCKTYHNVELGRRCFEHIVRLGCKDSSGYALMSDIYVNAKMWNEAHKVQDRRRCASILEEARKDFHSS